MLLAMNQVWLWSRSTADSQKTIKKPPKTTKNFNQTFVAAKSAYHCEHTEMTQGDPDEHVNIFMVLSFVHLNSDSWSVDNTPLLQ